jgi:tetratricopeptide (TPR) repeat protein
VTREILQYASTIEEAIAIAKSREVFVSEAIFVGSAKDKKATVIEVSPNNFGIYEIPNSNQLICSNHFQSNAFQSDKRNQKQIEESHSKYRFDRMTELIAEENKLDSKQAVAILRNKEGLNGKSIGFGNEKALNQLLAHHGIVFKPEELLVWVSTNPYQLGEFVAYDLNEVFKDRADNPTSKTISEQELTIVEDSFVRTEEFENYEIYRKLERELEAALNNDNQVSSQVLSEIRSRNRDYWKSHYLVGKYYYKNKNYSEALEAFEEANSKEITTIPDRKNVTKYIKKSKRKANDT